jgi:small nuclear ribonucleoprotein (snRNP)-like protein
MNVVLTSARRVEGSNIEDLGECVLRGSSIVSVEPLEPVQ